MAQGNVDGARHTFAGRLFGQTASREARIQAGLDDRVRRTAGRSRRHCRRRSSSARSRSVDWSRPLGPTTYDTIHAFTSSRAELAAGLPKLRKYLNKDGTIWISWPKKAARVPTDVTEDVVRAEALKLDLVDVKVAAVDDIWSGLKLVIRVHLR